MADADDEEAVELLTRTFRRGPDVRTRRGGHWYFRHPRDGKVTSGKAFLNGKTHPKIDIKGDAALVALPPSTNKTWTNGIPDPASLPVFPRALKPKKAAREDRPDQGKSFPKERLEEVSRVIAEHYPAEGNRHEAGMALVGHLANRKLSERVAHDVILAAREMLPRPITEKTLKSIEGVVETTYQRKADGEVYTAGPTLEEFAPGLTQAIDEALGLRDQAGYKLRTDLGNADRFVEQHRSRIRWVPKYNRWIVWEGQRWKLDDGGAAVRLAKETARKLLLEAYRTSDEEERKKMNAWAAASQSNRAIKAMIELARAELEIEPGELDADPWLLNVANGTIDLRTGELLEHDPERLMTKLAPVDYDPEAEAPRFMQFLREVLVEDELIGFMQRFLGYSLTGSVRERCLAVLHGVGKNGKSTLVEVFQDMLADYSATVDVEVLLKHAQPNATASYALAELAGARFVSTSEVEEDGTLAEGRIKAITGGDTISARAPYGRWFDYRPQFKLWMSTNHKPVIKGTDDAIWDRLKLTPFTQRFDGDKADPELPAKLREELPGILAWAVRGALDWQRGGLREPKAVSKATREYRQEMDHYAEFIEQMCIFETGARERASDMWSAWQDWLEDEQGVFNAGEKSKFNKRIERAGNGAVGRKREKSGMVWLGVRLRGEDDNDPGGGEDPPSGVAGVDGVGDSANFSRPSETGGKLSKPPTLHTPPTPAQAANGGPEELSAEAQHAYNALREAGEVHYVSEWGSLIDTYGFPLIRIIDELVGAGLVESPQSGTYRPADPRKNGA